MCADSIFVWYVRKAWHRHVRAATTLILHMMRQQRVHDHNLLGCHHVRESVNLFAYASLRIEAVFEAGVIWMPLMDEVFAVIGADDLALQTELGEIKVVLVAPGVLLHVGEHGILVLNHIPNTPDAFPALGMVRIGIAPADGEEDFTGFDDVALNVLKDTATTDEHVGIQEEDDGMRGGLLAEIEPVALVEWRVDGDDVECDIGLLRESGGPFGHVDIVGCEINDDELPTVGGSY